MVGQTFTITSGGDGSAVGTWEIIGTNLQSGSTAVNAIWTGAGIPTQNQTNLNWHVGANTGSGVSMLTSSRTVFQKLTGLAAATQTNIAANLSNGWKNYVRIKNAVQTWLNGTFRVFSASNSNIPGFSDGSVVLYIVNNVAFDNSGYTTPATLPEYGVGGSLGAPRVQYQMLSALIRAQGSAFGVENITIPAVQGIGLWVDGSRYLTIKYEVKKVGISGPGGGLIPFIFESASFGRVRDCQTTNSIGVGISNSCSALLTGSTADLFTAGSIYFDNFFIGGAPLLMQYQGGVSTSQGGLYFDYLVTEDLTEAPIFLDPRGGVAAEILVRNQSQNDGLSPGATVDELVAGHLRDFQSVRIQGGGSNQQKLLGPNTLTPVHLEVRIDEVNTASGYDLAATQDYILEKNNRLDAALVGAPASFGPTIEQGFNVPLIDPSGWDAITASNTALPTVTYPSSMRGPDGISNATFSKLIPLFHSTDGSYQAKVVSPNGLSGVSFPVAVGDYFMLGGWVKASNISAVLTQIPFGMAFISFGGGVSINGGQELPLTDSQANFIGGQWLYISTIGKITTANVSPNGYFVVVGTDATSDVAYRGLWAKYIPVSAGIPEREIIRWYRHGSRSFIPGVATGNLGIDGYQSLDWAGRATLGSPASGQLSTNATTMLFNGITGLLDTMNIISNADTTVVATTANQIIGMKALTANHTVTLPASPSVGQKVIVKDVDGSLASFNIISGNGHNIDGASTFTLTNANAGPKAAISLYYASNTDGWIII